MKTSQIGFLSILIIFLFSPGIWALDYSKHTDEQLRLVWHTQLFLDEEDKQNFMAEWYRRFQYVKPGIVQSHYAPPHESYHYQPPLNFYFSFKSYKDGHRQQYGYPRYPYYSDPRFHHYKQGHRKYPLPKQHYQGYGFPRYRHNKYWHKRYQPYKYRHPGPKHRGNWYN